MMHETAGLNTYLDDYIMDCQCVSGPSLQASSVWCAAVLHQRMYLFQYSSKKSNIGFKLKQTAQVPPFGAGPSRSCFCCSRSLSSGDGPGPDHRDYKTNRVFIVPYSMVLSVVRTMLSVTWGCAIADMHSHQPLSEEARPCGICGEGGTGMWTELVTEAMTAQCLLMRERK